MNLEYEYKTHAPKFYDRWQSLLKKKFLKWPKALHFQLKLQNVVEI